MEKSPRWREIVTTDFVLHTGDGEHHQLSLAADDAIEVNINLQEEVFFDLADTFGAAARNLRAAKRSGQKPEPASWGTFRPDQ